MGVIGIVFAVIEYFDPAILIDRLCFEICRLDRECPDSEQSNYDEKFAQQHRCPPL
jgi:hypothetical protein